MFPVAEPQREQVLWEEKGSWFLEDWKHDLQKGLEGDEIMQAHTALMGKSEGWSPRNQEERNYLFIHSTNIS